MNGHQIVVHPYERLLLRNRKDRLLMCITDEFHKMFSWEKEADKGVHPVRFHTHEF